MMCNSRFDSSVTFQFIVVRFFYLLRLSLFPHSFILSKFLGETSLYVYSQTIILFYLCINDLKQLSNIVK